MFRPRDIVAILLAVWLIRLANQQEKTLNAALHLAFYTHASVFAPFDVDGDGTIEALAIVTGDKSKRMLEILDLKPLHSSYLEAAAPPFRPKTMLQASIAGDASPLKITTGQIMIKHAPKKQKAALLDAKPAEYTERTRHYFCGSDWHDASQKCQQPCPGGTPGECSGDEKCFADTPCNALDTHNNAQSNGDFKYQLTPAGGLPSVVTLWSDGSVTMHSVTSDEGNNELELKELWTQRTPLGVDVYDLVLLGDQDFSSGSEQGQHGVVLVGGTSQPSSVIHALDVMTGQLLWNSQSESAAEGEQAQLTTRGTGSVARRRSRLLEAGDTADLALPNCWTTYRHSILKSVKPYWGHADAKWYAVHLDRRSHKKKKHPKSRKWHHRHAQLPLHGRPNALLQRHEGGIQVRSLKNGRSLCHLPLLDRVLYSDINHDGTLDQLQAVTDAQGQAEDNMEWIINLSRQVAMEDKAKPSKAGQPRRHHRLCHLLALSGWPAREQLFTTSLCPGGSVAAGSDLSSAPPLLTSTGEVIVALSNGLLSKHDARTGKRAWQHYGHPDAPTWHTKSNAAMVTSLFPDEPASPILTTGENSMTLFSSTRGKVLATAVFPQATKSRPVFEDWSGDDTLDVLIQTPDAVWGYRVLVHSTGTFSRILVGLLLVVILLALLRNRFVNSSGDKRSTEK